MIQVLPVHYLLLLLCLLLGACQGYDIRVNERIVYTPDPLFSAFEVSDSALADCISETIAHESVTAAARLLSLNCSHAGIASLEGLAVFSGLEVLRLSSNSVRNLVELGGLSGLRELYLDDNAVVDPVPLYQLPNLRYLDLSKNPDLQCPADAGLEGVTTVILPDHCR